jgi:hypothetical protein
VAALGACCTVVVAAVIGATAGIASPDGYPPPVTPTCVASIASTTGSTQTVALGEPFTPGSTVALTVNGAAYGTATAPADGSALDLVIATTDPHLAINGGPAVAVNFGVNTVGASGPSPSGATQSCTVTVDIVNAGSSSASSGGTGVTQANSGTGSGGSSLGSAGAGSTFKSAPIGLAFTGADLALIVLAALLLLIVGAGLLGYGRRRRRHHFSD